MRDDARANLGDTLRRRAIVVPGHYFVELGAVGEVEHVVAGEIPKGYWVETLAVCGALVGGRPRSSMEQLRVCRACLEAATRLARRAPEALH